MSFNSGTVTQNAVNDPMNIILLTLLNRYLHDWDARNVVITRDEFLRVQEQMGERRHLRIDFTDESRMIVTLATMDEIEAEQADLAIATGDSILDFLLRLEDRLTSRQSRGVDTDSTADPNAPQRGADVAGEPSTPQP